MAGKELSKLPKEKDLLSNIGKIAYTLDKAYMRRLSGDYGVLRFDENYKPARAVEYDSNIRAVKIDRWVYDKDEKTGDCFKNILSTFADGDHTIALVVKRTSTNTEMYLVVKNEGANRNEESAANVDLLENSIKGNFQGSQTRKIEYVDELQSIFSFDDKILVDGHEEDMVSSIALLTNTPSEFSKDYIGQGLDKLLNGIIPEDDKENYTLIFLAESLKQENIREIISAYEEMATAVAPFQQYQFQVGKNTTESTGEMRSLSNSESVSDSISRSHAINAGLGATIGMSSGESPPRKDGQGKNTGGGIKGIPAAIVKATINGLGNLIAVPHAGEVSSSLSLNGGYGYNWGKTKTNTQGQTTTTGTNRSISTGSSESTTYTYKSYLVSDLLEKLEATISRINKSQATGLWKYSTYVLSYDSTTSISVANYLKGITQGKESFVEPAVVQEWSRQYGKDSTPFDEIKKYLSHFTHPEFITADAHGDNPMVVTGTSYVATDELANVFAFPRKSLQGLPVLEGVQFGREANLLSPDAGVSDLEIGNGYHMYREYGRQRIKLSTQELRSHTFITGSTGSGKSNTVYTLLHQLTAGDESVRFLVIEPAKGEYRQAFADRLDVACFSTNPKLQNTEMLRINPFSFPPSIHILEHMDRLVEIFNVCWPMYAAMPAILKDAIERAYVEAGWDLVESENRYDNDLFPSFSDVVQQIRDVLNSSEYSADNKSDYTGALVTRLRSLTNGINGQVFTADALPDEALFDRNVIIDLSRVGSSETKSLIMGILVLKLQEHRMQSKEPNSPLSHVTVLEEAHNLLKRTSTEQTPEGSNLLGKSVEMLANAIAEMRTYGEGFIIADQSPGLLDMSVIRNTNTKIIMRLPDYEDRELVGRAAGLNEEQIVELGRLERGVAAISQSNWLEPVLCKVDLFRVHGTQECRQVKALDRHEPMALPVEASVLDCIMTKELYRKGNRADIRKLKDSILRSRLSATVKCDLLDYISAGREKAFASLRKLVYDFFEANEAIQKSRDCRTIEEWASKVAGELKPSVQSYANHQIDLLLALILYEQTLRDRSYENIMNSFTELYQNRGGVYK